MHFCILGAMFPSGNGQTFLQAPHVHQIKKHREISGTRWLPFASMCWEKTGPIVLCSTGVVITVFKWMPRHRLRARRATEVCRRGSVFLWCTDQRGSNLPLLLPFPQQLGQRDPGMVRDDTGGCGSSNDCQNIL